MHTRPFFIYGTLLDADIRRHVFGRDIAAQDVQYATVAGYVARTYPGDSFPVMVKQPDGLLHGALLFHLSQSDYQRMDFYEGDEYGFGVLDAVTASGDTITASVNQPAQDDLHSDDAWTLEHWQTLEKPHFLGLCERYMALFGTMTTEQADVIWRAMVDEPTTVLA